ncbi:MAG: hypothetical protein Q9209_005515 [Squamulea sp. 1 TL-2023]
MEKNLSNFGNHQSLEFDTAETPKVATDVNTSNGTTHALVPELAVSAILKPSAPASAEARTVIGVEFSNHTMEALTAQDLVQSMASMGYQAGAVAEAARIINGMMAWKDPETHAGTTIFLGYTSNMVTSGLRETLRWLVEHKHVSAIVTTAGGVEEDLIKCLGPTYVGEFNAVGAELREKGMNRVGNLLIPNENYAKFEDWLMPILGKMFAEQEESKKQAAEAKEEPLMWTPSTFIHRLGKEMNNKDSICYWAYKNNIPIFSPALTDGSIGDMLAFHSYKTSPKFLDLSITRDIRSLTNIALQAKRAGMIILGGGLVKHHIANACLMRNGADSAVYINTAQEFDGSDAGASPDEAVSWGKIKAGADVVKVHADATICFNLIVAASFAKVDKPNRSSPKTKPPWLN